MKNIIIATILALFLPIAARTQVNLVLNPALEQYSICPNNMDCATYCTHWNTLDSSWRAPDWVHSKNGVPEYCNTCAPFGHASVPYNIAFRHYPRSGNGMMQLQMFAYNGDTGYARDYLQGHLAHQLVASHNYEVCFYTSSEQLSGYAVSHIGAYLDDGTIDTTDFPCYAQTQYTPQIVDTNIINDTLNWIKIKGTFTATGNEKLITIGQFQPSAQTKIDTISGGWAWYLIDDVSVIDCSNIPFAGHDTVIHMGDSVFLGSHEPLLPYTWCKLGSSSIIDSSGGIWVKPAVSTSYVLKQVLCDVVRFDTVKVWVWPDTPASIVNGQLLIVNVQVYPNPVTEELTVEGAKGCEVTFYDVVGRVVALPTGRGSAYHATTNKEVFDIAALDKGVYIVEIVDMETGSKITRKIIKE